IEQTEHGQLPADDGWFIINLEEIAWETVEGGGTWCVFESPHTPRNPLGIGVHVLPPGEAPGFYHWESDQEGFLVLSGACVAVVEGQERRMGRWDYLHCPPGTAHIMIGADGDEPCAVLMVGARTAGKLTRYPPDPVAAAHGASVTTDAVDLDSRAAYAQWPVQPRTFRDVPAPWPDPRP
ncbi:MAG TPA: cupin domain-containing protein, partial [Baekduia sp.]|nr:cupin domain-containing protein [Baekduia sp.]